VNKIEPSIFALLMSSVWTKPFEKWPY